MLRMASMNQGGRREFWDFLGVVTGTAIDTLTASGTYKPKLNGRMVKLRVQVSGIAATTLQEGGYIQVDSVSFGGVPVVCSFAGIGLQTVPRSYIPAFEVECNVPVKETQDLTISYYNNVTPTTPEIIVTAKFVEG